MGMPRPRSSLRRRRTALFAIAVWILMTGGAESDVVEGVNDLRGSTSSQGLVPPLEGSSTSDLQVFGAPKNHDLGSTGAYAVQLQSKGDNEDNGEDDEDFSLSDNEHALAFEDEVEDDPNDLGASVVVGRRGGELMTSGSFVLGSGANRAGNDEDEFGEEDDFELGEPGASQSDYLRAFTKQCQLILPKQSPSTESSKSKDNSSATSKRRIAEDCGGERGKIGCKYTYHKGFAIRGPTVKSLSTKTECECQRLCDQKIACLAITFASSRSAGTSAAYQSGWCILKSASKKAAHGHINKYKNLDVYIKNADCPNYAAPAIRCP